jgi:phosphoglucomutase
MSIQQELTELEANFSNFNNPDEPTTKGTFKKMISGEYGKPLISNYDFFQIDSYHSNKLSPELCKLIKEKIASSDFTSNIPEQDIKEATRMSNDILDFTDLNDGSKLHNNVAKILTEELTRRSYLSESQIEKMGSSIDTYLEEFTYKNSESDEIERDLVQI